MVTRRNASIFSSGAATAQVLIGAHRPYRGHHCVWRRFIVRVRYIPPLSPASMARMSRPDQIHHRPPPKRCGVIAHCGQVMADLPQVPSVGRLIADLRRAAGKKIKEEATSVMLRRRRDRRASGQKPQANTIFRPAAPPITLTGELGTLPRAPSSIEIASA